MGTAPLAAFCRVEWNRSNMLTDVDMPVALATSAPISCSCCQARQHLAPAPSAVLTATSASTFSSVHLAWTSYPLPTLCSCSRMVTSATIHSCFTYTTSGVDECSLRCNCA